MLDIVPTATIYDTLDQQRATVVWRYFFLVQPPDLPERMIGAHPEGYLRSTLAEWCQTPGALSEDAVAEYLGSFEPAAIHATCEDYRAGATIDLDHDRADAGRRLGCPTLVMWSKTGIGSTYDVAGIWRERAPHARCLALDCGHFLAEERAELVTDALIPFLSENPSGR